MLASLYAVAAVIACIEFLMLFVLIKKPSPKHILILAAVMVSSFGYLALSVSRTLEEALLANKILYVGSYLPLLMLVTTAEFCKFGLPTWLKRLLYLGSTTVLIFIYVPALNHYYYRTVTTGRYMDILYIEKTYGPVHSLYSFLLLFDTALCTFIVLRTLRKQKNVARRITFLLIGGLVSVISIYFIERALHLPVDLVPFGYIVVAGFYVIIARTMQTYDISYRIEEVFGHSEENAYMSFDRGLCIMNYNEMALSIFPALSDCQIGDNTYDEESLLYKNIVNWLKYMPEAALYPTESNFNVETKYYHCVVNKIHTRTGRYAGYMVEVSDDTKQQQHAKLMSEYNKTLEKLASTATRADKAKSHFLAQMSHEIRTPINAILGMNEMILRESDDVKILEYSENIRSSGRTLMSLINSILDFSKIEDGKMEIIPVDYDTVSLINDLVLMTRERAVTKGLSLDLEIDPALPKTLHGDDIRLKQIISNILTNAVKYTNEGGIVLKMQVRYVSGNNLNLYVEVTDTGVGIKDEDKRRLFSSFERLDEEKNRGIEGSGLGMAIVQRLLSMMDSKLNLRSVYGVGSTFYFELIQEIADKTPIGDYNSQLSHAEVSRTAETYLYAPSARILVVDDNEMNLQVVKGLLKRNGVMLDTAMSGAEAIKLVETNTYDMIFLDHLMPQMDGVETLAEMRRMGLLSEKLFVIAMTANAIVGARDEYLKAGFDDYLSKPVEIKDMEMILEKYLPNERVTFKTAKAHQEPKKTGGERKIPENIAALAEYDLSLNVIASSAGLSYANGNRQLYNNMIKAFIAESEEIKGALAAYTAESDQSSIYYTLSKLSDSAALIGAEYLSDYISGLLGSSGSDLYLKLPSAEKAYEDLLDVIAKGNF
ncbi:MAG: response regulator [Lachnospiraceae bacterium]|nr:response regulator [Lachnospiraceae bacterium]